MSDAPKISIFGLPKMGKSSLQNQLAAALDHVIIFDYLVTRRQAAEKMGLMECTSMEQVKAAVAAGYGKAIRIWYRPPMQRQVQALHELSKFIWRIQSPIVEANKVPPRIHLFIDEMKTAYPVTNLPEDLKGFDKLCTAGRHYNICVIGSTQRPAQINTEFRGTCDTRYYFRLDEAVDVKAVELSAGKEVAKLVQNLPPYHYIRKGMDGISMGKTSI